MSDTVGDYLLERLRAWGIKRIYGYPGDGINGIIGSFSRLSDGEGPEFTQVRHEEMAAFMACAHAKFTGEVGVCLATSGPGAIHLLNGLYDAKLDHQPVVAIVGQQARAGLGGNYQQEVDLNSLFKDVAHEYVEVAMAPTQIRHLVDRAIRIALSERTVTAIIIPNDVQEADAVPQPPHAHGTVHSGPGYQPPRILPHDEDLDRAAEILNAGERVAMLVGQGALHASEEVVAVAELLGAGVAKALLGKAVLPDDLPFVTGSIGLLGTKPSWTMMQECDTLLMVGSSFPYSEFLPEEGNARGVQIDIDGKMIGIRYPMEVNLVGDSGATLRALMSRLHRKEDRSWREKIEGEVSEWWDLMEHRAQLTADPINPQLVFHELSTRLPDGAIISSDSGSSANWYARDIKLRKGMMASLSGTLATMGPGVPYAIAAKFAYPSRPVFALVGDGAMQMNGINELITIAKYRDQWPDQRLVVLVLNNRDLNQVTWEQRAMEGDAKFEGSQDLPDFPYARYAELSG
jgi:pyruvate dehydrogenase (quinone)